MFLAYLLNNIAASEYNLLMPLIHAHTYPLEVYGALYADLDYEDQYLSEIDDEPLTEKEIKKISTLDVGLIRASYMDEDLLEIPDDNIGNVTADGMDVAEYNEVSTKIYNFTRRGGFSYYMGWTDRYDWLDGWPFSESMKFELNKIKRFEKYCLTFLLHARYQMESAFQQRLTYRDDKRYKLGYLFNRLRRLKTEMLKFVSVANTMYNFQSKEFQNMTSLMRLYERVVYFDVDIRDTTALIYAVYNSEAAVDFEDGSVTDENGNYRVTPKMAPPLHNKPPPPGHSKNNEDDTYQDDLEQLMG